MTGRPLRNSAPRGGPTLRYTLVSNRVRPPAVDRTLSPAPSAAFPSGEAAVVIAHAPTIVLPPGDSRALAAIGSDSLPALNDRPVQPFKAPVGGAAPPASLSRRHGDAARPLLSEAGPRALSNSCGPGQSARCAAELERAGSHTRPAMRRPAAATTAPALRRARRASVRHLSHRGTNEERNADQRTPAGGKPHRHH